MLPDSDNGSRFFFLFPLYCLTDVRVAGGTQMVILRRNIPTCLPLYNQANIGQRDCPCLQIVWQPSRRRTVVGVLGYPAICFVASRQASHTINIGSADRAVEDSCRLVNITIKAINRVGLLCFILIYTPQQ